MRYTESFKNFITGSILLASLLNNPVSGHENKKQLKDKAKMSMLDSNQLSTLSRSLDKYELYKKGDLSSSNILFTSGNGMSFKDALENAEKDVDVKIDFLGKKGSQQIYFIKVTGTYRVIILTQIL